LSFASIAALYCNASLGWHSIEQQTIDADSGELLVDRARRVGTGRSAKRSEFRLPTILDRIREMEKRTDSKAPQPAVVSVSRYGDVASDLDRISSAGSTDEVLRIVNEVLGLLDRSGISEQPFVPLPSALSSHLSYALSRTFWRNDSLNPTLILFYELCLPPHCMPYPQFKTGGPSKGWCSALTLLGRSGRPWHSLASFRRDHDEIAFISPASWALYHSTR